MRFLVHIKDNNNSRKQCSRHSTKEIEFLITLAVLREYQMLQAMQRILQESFCMFHKQSMLGFLVKALMWQRTKTCKLWTKNADKYFINRPISMFKEVNISMFKEVKLQDFFSKNAV